VERPWAASARKQTGEPTATCKTPQQAGPTGWYGAASLAADFTMGLHYCTVIKKKKRCIVVLVSAHKYKY